MESTYDGNNNNNIFGNNRDSSKLLGSEPGGKFNCGCMNGSNEQMNISEIQNINNKSLQVIMNK